MRSDQESYQLRRRIQHSPIGLGVVDGLAVVVVSGLMVVVAGLMVVVVGLLVVVVMGGALATV